MKSILFHCKDVGSVITGLSTRPQDIIHADILDKKQSAHNCILVLLTVEEGDALEKSKLITQEVMTFCNDTKHNNVFLLPFAHLSNKLANAKDALLILEDVSKQLVTNNLNVTMGHFGSDKELLVHIHGHPGNVRYREF